MDQAMKEAFHDMLAALKQCTARADDDLKNFSGSRTYECALDYARCMSAIAKAENCLVTANRHGSDGDPA